MVEPYYERDGIALFHGDGVEFLRQLPSITATAVITDPQYNAGFEYGDEVNDSRGDYREWCSEWFQECRRVGRIVVFTPGTTNVGMWYSICPPKWILAWHKPAAMGRSPVGICNWEPVLLWGEEFGNRGSDVITARIVPLKDAGTHPCPKPLKWAESLIELLTDSGNIVVDPFVGSGTTLVAAHRLGRRAIGCELVEEYCETAAKRIDREISQGRLFSDAPADQKSLFSVRRRR